MTLSRNLAAMLMAAMSMVSLAAEPAAQSDAARVTADDFATLAGDGWRGALRYLDYSSHTEKRIPVEMRFDEPGKRTVVYHIRYPGETQYNASEKLKWSGDGRRLNGKPLVTRSREADGTLILVTEFDGKDDNRPAEIRMTYSFNASALTISRDVRFEGDARFFRRNTYELRRE
jgi:hypothetical protein